MSQITTDPAPHYNRVTPAWRYLLGDNLHYGYFATGKEDLNTATEALTRRMAEVAQLGAGHSIVSRQGSYSLIGHLVNGKL